MHDHGHAQLARELPCGGEMVGVGMSVDEITETQAVACGQGHVAVDLAERGIDEHRRAGFLATHKVGAAAARGYGFKYHAGSSIRQNSNMLSPGSWLRIDCRRRDLPVDCR